MADQDKINTIDAICAWYAQELAKLRHEQEAILEEFLRENEKKRIEKLRNDLQRA